MLKIILAIAITSCLSLSAYSLNIKENLNDESLKEAVSGMLPYERDYVPYLLKEFKEFECLNISNLNNKLGCGGINKLLIKEEGDKLNVVLSGYALKNEFSYIEPFFRDKNGFNITPLNIKVKSDGDGVSVVNNTTSSRRLTSSETRMSWPLWLRTLRASTPARSRLSPGASSMRIGTGYLAPCPCSQLAS